MATTSDRFLVGTRKGLFDVRRRGREWTLGKPALAGQPIANAVRDPRTGTTWASIDHGHWGVKLARSKNDGGTFDETPPPKYPESAGVAARYYWELQPGHADERDTFWVGTEPGGLFVTRDDGATWSMVESLWRHRIDEKWFGGGRNEPGIHSVQVDPRDARRMHVGVSCGGTLETRDGGDTWAYRNEGVKTVGPEGVDVHRLVRAPSEPDVLWQANHMGVYVSRDAGRSWKDLTQKPYVSFGFPVAVHPERAGTAWLVPMDGDANRTMVNGSMVVMRTDDFGDTWTQCRTGLPQQDAYDFPYRHALDVGSDGETLVFGTTSGNLYVSPDGGVSWRSIGTNLPLIYSVRFA
jgi:photosystem II stability/assembly factor-like uncharacterized protein